MCVETGSHGKPETCSIKQADLQLIDIHLPLLLSTGIKGMGHHGRQIFFFFNLREFFLFSCEVIHMCLIVIAFQLLTQFGEDGGDLNFFYKW